MGSPSRQREAHRCREPHPAPLQGSGPGGDCEVRARVRELPRGPYSEQASHSGRSSAWLERRVWDAEVRRFESGRPDYALADDRGYGSERRRGRAGRPRARRAGAAATADRARRRAGAGAGGRGRGRDLPRRRRDARGVRGGRDRLPRVGLGVRGPRGGALQRRRRRRDGRGAPDRLRVVHGRRARLRLHVRARPRRDGGADPLDRARPRLPALVHVRGVRAGVRDLRGRDPRTGGRGAGGVRLARRRGRRRRRGARLPGEPRRAHLRRDRPRGALARRGGGAAGPRRRARGRLRARDARAGAPVAAPQRRAGVGDRGLGDLLRRARRGRSRAAVGHRPADPRPPAALARRRAARAPREHCPPVAVKRIEAANDAGYAAPIGLAADPVVFTLLDGRLSVLLARRLEEPQRGMFALPGGFVGAEESPEQTAERKLREKTGVGSVHLEQLRTYAEPARDPRGWLPSIAYLALVPPGALPEQTPADRDASWHPLDALPELALDHARIVDDGLWRLRARIADKAWFMRVGAGLLPEEFTLRQAQRLYEAIAGESLDPANFRRDVKATGLLADTGRRRTEGPGRPGTLYRLFSD